MEDQIYMAIFWLVENEWTVFGNGWDPIPVDNMDTCEERKTFVEAYIKSTDLVAQMGATQFQAECGLLKDMVLKFGKAV